MDIFYKAFDAEQLQNIGSTVYYVTAFSLAAEKRQKEKSEKVPHNHHNWHGHLSTEPDPCS